MGTRSSFADSDIQSDSELSTLMAEITSLERERKDLIGSLTPGISRWVDEISGTATSSVRDKVDCNEPFGILEDIEGLGHRMLSMSHFLSSSNSHIPLYKADELVSISSKLMKISKDFYKSTELAMEKVMVDAAEAVEKRKEEERKEEKKKRERMRKKEKEKKKKQQQQQQQKEKDEEDKKKRGMMRKKEKKKKKQQQHKEEDAQVTSEKITEKMERKEEQEEEEEEEAEETRRQQAVRKMMPAHEFLRLSSNVLARPCCYRNELAMMITEEDEQEYERVREAKRQAEMEAEEAKREAERKAQRERERQRERSKQRKAEREAKRKQMPQKEPIVEEEQPIVEEEHADEQEAKSPKEQLKERMDNQLGFFAGYKQRKAEREAKRKQMPQKEPIVEEEQPIVEEEHADEQEAKSPKEQLKERMDNQLGFFADYRTAWEYSSGSKAGLCGGFKDKTTLSPMQFTHCIPGIIPPRAAVIESTLQIYSFKITGLSDDLKWPLNVYGVVAARDTVDHNRNLLFSRSSIMCQVLKSENDCSLCLTGPSRAILAMDPVDFEVELRVHDGCNPRGDELNDRELICVSSRYEVATSGELPLAPSSELPCLTFHSPLCTAKLSLERLPSTIQATILSVRVVGGESPFKSGVQVSCWSSSADGSAAMHEVVLLDSLEGIPQEYDELDLDGYLPLSRNVVSVECGGVLDVVVKAYGGSGSTSTHIYFPSEYGNITQRTCSVCGSQVDITVAWSRLVRDKMDLLIDGYTTQA